MSSTTLLPTISPCSPTAFNPWSIIPILSSLIFLCKITLSALPWPSMRTALPLKLTKSIISTRPLPGPDKEKALLVEAAAFRAASR